MRYGVDYFIGDTVAVEIDGTRITQPVAEVTIKIGDSGAVTTPTIGDPRSRLIPQRSTRACATSRSAWGLVERRK